MNLQEFEQAFRAKIKLKLRPAHWKILARLYVQPQLSYHQIVEVLYPGSTKKPATWEKIPGIYIAVLRQILSPYNIAIAGKGYNWWIEPDDKQRLLDLVNKLQTSINKIDFEASFAYNRWFMAVHEPSGEYVPQVFSEERYKYANGLQSGHAPRLWRNHISCERWLGRNKSITQTEYKILPVQLKLGDKSDTQTY